MDYSSDDDIENYDLKPIGTQIDTGTKRFYNFLIRQAPANTLSSILKIYALRELRSYNSKDNLIQSNNLDEINEYQPVLYKSNKSKSTTNLTGITRVSNIRRSQSLSCIDTVNPSEDFIEINSIRVGLEKLQSILTKKNQAVDVSTSFENQNDLNVTLSRNDDALIQLQNDCECYVETINGLRDKLDALSRDKIDLDRTNASLQIQMKRERKNYENLDDYCNSTLQRVDDLLNEKEELETVNQKLNDELERHKHLLHYAETDLKGRIEEVKRLTKELGIASDEVLKLKSEAIDCQRHLHAQILNKVDTIAQFEKHNKQLEGENEDLKIKLRNNLNEANEERKRNEDKLTLANVKLKYLEESLVSTRNQNNDLRKTYQDLNKIIEDQRQEILNLKNFKENTANCLIRENETLKSKNQKMLIDLHNEIAIKSEIENTLKMKEEKYNESLQIIEDLKTQFSRLEKENVKLRIILKDENDLKTQHLQELTDSKNKIANLKNGIQTIIKIQF